MPRFNEKVDVRRERRALTADELRRLIRAAETGEPFRGMSGSDRAMLYRVAMETGLRWSELRSLRRQSFNLTSNPPTVTVAAVDSKHRQEDILPLRQELSEALLAYFTAQPALPTAKAFPHMPPGTVGAKLIRFDLAKTGDPERNLEPIPFKDSQGQVADFHALRHSFVTALARSGIHPSVAQSLARHSSITLTMDTYTHAVLESQKEAIERLPDLSSYNDAVAQKTGTDDKGAEITAANWCPNSAILPQNNRISSDTVGQTASGYLTGEICLNSLTDNEKALQVNDLQGAEAGYPPGIRTPTYRSRICQPKKATP